MPSSMARLPAISADTVATGTPILASSSGPPTSNRPTVIMVGAILATPDIVNSTLSAPVAHAVLGGHSSYNPTVESFSTKPLDVQEPRVPATCEITVELLFP